MSRAPTAALRRMLRWFMALGLVGRPLLAQTAEAAIVGQVVDLGGAPLGRATVEARNAETGYTLRLETNTAGRFAFMQLPVCAA